VVAESFAAGVLSALAVGRLRRRRRYRPSEPYVGEKIGSDPPSRGVRDLLVALRSGSHDADEELTSPIAADEPDSITAQPDADSLLHPDVVEVASRGAEVVELALCEWPGLTMSGPGAESALRAWLSALVVRTGPYGAEIVAVEPLRRQLFDGLAFPNVFEVERTESALSRLETAATTRRALLDQAGAPDVATYRAQAPEDPLPLLLVVTDVVPTALRERWQNVMGTATRLGLGAVIVLPAHSADAVLGTHPQMVVGESGELLDAIPPRLAETVAGSQLFLLDAANATDLLSPIAAIYNDTDEEEEKLPDTGITDTGLTAVTSHTDTESSTDHELEVGPPAPTRDADVGSESENLTIRSSRWPARGDGGDEGPISVVLLGPAEVRAWGERVAKGLRSSAYELLAWYALHPEGARAEAAIDALWPDASPQRGRERFWTALGNLRSRLRGPGSEGTEILVKVGEHYRPDPAVLDIDLWRFETALVDAADAGDSSDVVAALRTASTLYGGDFSPSDGLWVEPVREELHRRALDVHIRLAELETEAGHSEAALAALERSIELDSICEDAYRRLIALQTDLGRVDAAQRTWVLLRGRLAELDLEPEAATSRLVHEVLPGRRTQGVAERGPRQGGR
jgi:DNA-binding SARP family transcriptional activator